MHIAHALVETVPQFLYADGPDRVHAIMVATGSHLGGQTGLPVQRLSPPVSLSATKVSLSRNSGVTRSSLHPGEFRE